MSIYATHKDFFTLQIYIMSFIERSWLHLSKDFREKRQILNQH